MKGAGSAKKKQAVLSRFFGGSGAKDASESDDDVIFVPDFSQSPSRPPPQSIATQDHVPLVVPESVPTFSMERIVREGLKSPERAQVVDGSINFAGLTPLEKLVYKLKEEHRGLLLVVENGYRYSFFGRDAVVAASILGIVAYVKEGMQFATASIPVQRLGVHVRRLAESGLRVGVVKQTESAASKKESGKSGLFARALVGVYSRGFLPSSDSVLGSGPVTERRCVAVVGGDAKGRCGAVFVDTDTWSVRYHACRGVGELRSSLAHAGPTEVFVPDVCVDSGAWQATEDVRTEVLSWARERGAGRDPCSLLVEGDVVTSGAEILGQDLVDVRAPMNAPIVTLWKQGVYRESSARKRARGEGVKEEEEDKAEDGESGLPKSCVGCMQFVQQWLDSLPQATPDLDAGGAQPLWTSRHVQLSDLTLRELEVLESRATGTVRGSLFGLLQSGAKTRGGRRLLREWVRLPLCRSDLIRERLEGVDSLMGDLSRPLQALVDALPSLPDIDRALALIESTSLPPQKLAATLKGLLLATRALRLLPVDTLSPILRRLFAEIPSDLADKLETELQNLSSEARNATPESSQPRQASFRRNPAAAAAAAKVSKDVSVTQAFRPEVEQRLYPAVTEARNAVSAAERTMRVALEEARSVLGLPSLEFRAPLQTGPLAGVEYLVEISRTSPSARRVPTTGTEAWTLVSETKDLLRYHTPAVLRQLHQVHLTRDTLHAACSSAYRSHLIRLTSELKPGLQRSSLALSTLDALFALGTASKRYRWTAPTIVDPVEGASIHATNIRHPMVEADAGRSRRMAESAEFTLVPNDVHLPTSSHNACVLVLSGPNMGGKSSYMRSIALCIVLAQIGSHVPASSCTLSPAHVILARAGAADDLARGDSTFRTEALQVAHLVNNASSRSFLFIDELGRGTSTKDGSAIACATAEYLAKQNARTVLTTHFPQLQRLAESNPALHNVHMQSLVHSTKPPKLTFLYKAIDGPAPASYGLNVARLAGIPPPIIERAQQIAEREPEK